MFKSEKQVFNEVVGGLESCYQKCMDAGNCVGFGFYPESLRCTGLNDISTGAVATGRPVDSYVVKR